MRVKDESTAVHAIPRRKKVTLCIFLWSSTQLFEVVCLNELFKEHQAHAPTTCCVHFFHSIIHSTIVALLIWHQAVTESLTHCLNHNCEPRVHKHWIISTEDSVEYIWPWLEEKKRPNFDYKTVLPSYFLSGTN